MSPKINTLIFGRVITMLNGRDPWIWFSNIAKVNKEERLYVKWGMVPENLSYCTLKKMEVSSIDQKN